MSSYQIFNIILYTISKDLDTLIYSEKHDSLEKNNMPLLCLKMPASAKPSGGIGPSLEQKA